jgi:hypothetical protein
MISTSVAAMAIDACFVDANIFNSIALASLPITGHLAVRPKASPARAAP